MALPFTIRLGQESDVGSLAAIITAAFSATDPAYPLIWGGSAPGTHEMVAVKGLFSPLQKEGRVTYVAVDTSTDAVVGFATWVLPKKNSESEKSGGRMPDIPGVNMKLWEEKLNGTEEARRRDVDPAKDLSLSLCFVHPDYQRKGVGTLLLQSGIERADGAQAKIWLTSTPQAVPTYLRNGWEVKEIQKIDLGEHGGEGIYNRAWMLRLPAQTMHEMG